jgi:hypothetical protein
MTVQEVHHDPGILDRFGGALFGGPTVLDVPELRQYGRENNQDYGHGYNHLKKAEPPVSDMVDFLIIHDFGPLKSAHSIITIIP